MSARTTELEQRLSELTDKEYRDAYVAEHIKQGIAFQIRAIRESRGWSQSELAERTDKKQSVISKLEHPDYGGYTLKTLKRLASAFDVGLVVRFVAFSKFLESAKTMTHEDLAPDAFSHETGSIALKSANSLSTNKIVVKVEQAVVPPYLSGEIISASVRSEVPKAIYITNPARRESTADSVGGNHETRSYATTANHRTYRS